MAAKLNRAFSTLFFALVFLNFLGTTRPDDPCPYPCYPPPTGTGTPTTPTTTTPPSPPSQTGYYPPPAEFNPSPTGNLPFNPPPSTGSSFGSPPPPDPILPYFPFYYKEPLHSTAQPSATAPGRSAAVISTSGLVVSICIFAFM